MPSSPLPDDPAERLLEAALAHVPFDGWSDAALRAAAVDTGVSLPVARALFPRGGVDLALAYHARGDRAMLSALAATDLTGIRFRDRIATAVRLRIQGTDRELVRRATALFALPQNAPAGAQAVWGTADLIWTALGDTSDDINWYSKRAILSGVHAATLLFWLGDDATGAQATWEFLDRRIENVMQFEAFKAAVGKNPVLKALLAVPAWGLGRIRAPAPAGAMPGSWGRPGGQGQ